MVVVTAPLVLHLDEIDRSQTALAGGKGANLGELSRLDGVRVPPGFCVTTAAFTRAVGTAIADRLDRLSRVDPDDREAIAACSADVRAVVESLDVPDDVATAIGDALAALGADAVYAVRSSATAEDSPTTSFAGLQDTFLDVAGTGAIVEHVRRCWASLFTERAVAYRSRNGIDQATAAMAVVVQRMVDADAAGVMFTADPMSGNRRVVVIESVAGLGESLVAGRAAADVHRVRDGEVIAAAITGERPVLADALAIDLAALGRRIEAHFGAPQDVEWCLDGAGWAIVQSRPITTLFPIPAAVDDGYHVYVSVGHGQMMTEPLRPLGVSVRQLTAGPPMHEAGGRLFVDVTQALASPVGRAGLLATFDENDPLIGDALRQIVDRGELPAPPTDAPASAASPPRPTPPATPEPIAIDPSIVTLLVERTEASVAALARDLADLSGPALFDAIVADFPELKRVLFDPLSHRALMAGMDGVVWLNRHLEAWLGEAGGADALIRSVPHDVTAEMGLALLDVADAVRPHPAVVAFLERVDGDDGFDGFLDELPQLDGGRDARGAIEAWLDRYGMRGVGEVDITRPRWRERPSMLVPLILGNVRNFGPGEAERRFEAGRQAARRAEQEVLERLRALPDGAAKADETEQMIRRVRTFIGYREFPKYGFICRYFVYKQAILGEADRLVGAGVLDEREDAFFLTFPELHDVVRTHRVDGDLIGRRRAELERYEALRLPRVLTSDGETLDGSYRRGDVPAGALVGLAVSTGVVEGRARVVADMAAADLEPGDILVTAHTDPGWTPLFVTIAGLVTEIGGLMTHGAVVAREYGLPAVVGVEQATQLIRDGQRIRVDGTNGYVVMT